MKEEPYVRFRLRFSDGYISESKGMKKQRMPLYQWTARVQKLCSTPDPLAPRREMTGAMSYRSYYGAEWIEMIGVPI